MAGYPGLLDLPYSVVCELSALLDYAPVHNWRSLVDQLPDYSQQDILRLKHTRQLGGSPTKDLLGDLHMQGWTIVDLCTLARRAHIQVVVDILVKYCQSVELDSTPLLKSAKSAFSRTSAKSCSHRHGYPDIIAPPLHAREEAKQRYKLSSAETGCESVSYSHVLEATGGLDETPHSEGGHKLGEGGFGEVFYCRLTIRGETTEAAVKVLRKRDEGSINKEQFTTELSSLSRLCHSNLLTLLGHSIDGPHLCLIYPFMERGSLDKYITDKHTLTPASRVGVARGVASALNYLHNGSHGDTVVHRDVKSANVLLLSDWSPKLGDFGVVRVVPSDSSSLMTTTIVGTTIFMAPEYRRGVVTPATDVYAFGVVLFELLTGHNALDKVTRATEDDTDLVTYILELEEEPRDILFGQWNEGVWQRVWSIAERCLEHFDFKRPSSKEVIDVLQQ